MQPQIGGVNQYLYNGKELNDDFGLDWNDYGARWYDSSIGRWGGVDPLAEDYEGWSGYNYVMGNPLKFVDPDGMAPQWIPSVDRKGNILLIREKGDDVASLIKFFGGVKNTLKYVDEKHLSSTPAVIRLKEDNSFSKATKDAAENPEKYVESRIWKGYYESLVDGGNSITQEEAALIEKYGSDASLDNYNCHTAALCAATGKEFHNREAATLEDRNEILAKYFKNVDESELKFGSSIITFGNQHDATFFGKSKDGDIYTFTKNGPYVAPDVIKLEWLVKYPSFGKKVRNPDFNYDGIEGGSGFFNLK